MDEPQYELGESELEVLKTLWDLEPATVRQVLNRLHENGRQVAYTTVLTFLTRLEAKGFVASDKSGVAYVYRAKLSRDSLTRSRLSMLLEQLYDGAAAPLVLQLIQSESFSANEIAELRKLLADLDAPPKRRKKP